MRLDFFATAGVVATMVIGSFTAMAQVGDLAKLKRSRTYYTFDLTSPSAHQIKVYFQAPDEDGELQWESKYIAIQEDQDLTQLTDKNFLEVESSDVKPPEQYENIPAVLAPKGDEIVTAFKRVLGRDDLTNFVTVYNGYKALVRVGEYVPMRLLGPEGYSFWLGSESELQFFVDLAYKELSLANPEAVEVNALAPYTVGKEFIFSNINPDQLEPPIPDEMGNINPAEVQKIKWWDFAPPQAVDGSVLLSPRLQHDVEVLNDHYWKKDFNFNGVVVSDQHKQAYKSLERAILETTRRALNNENVNASIETILSRQGDSVLPPHFKQSIRFCLKIKVDVPEDSNLKKLPSLVEFELPLAEGDVSTERHDPITGMTIKLKGRFFGKDAGFEFTASDGKGTTVSLPFTFVRFRFEEIEGKKVLAPTPLKILERPTSGSDAFDLDVWDDAYSSNFVLLGE